MKRIGISLLLLLVISSPALAQSLKGPDQRGRRTNLPGNGPVPHVLTPAASVTLVVSSGITSGFDDDYNAANANTVYVMPPNMADAEVITLDHQTSGTAFTASFSLGSLVTTWASLIPGDCISGSVINCATTPPGQPSVCPIPSIGDAWFRWRYSAATKTATLMACSFNPPRPPPYSFLAAAGIFGVYGGL